MIRETDEEKSTDRKNSGSYRWIPYVSAVVVILIGFVVWGIVQSSGEDKQIQGTSATEVPSEEKSTSVVHQGIREKSGTDVFRADQSAAEGAFGKLYSILWGDEGTVLSQALLPYYGGSFINDERITICFKSDVPAEKIKELRGEMIKSGVSEQTFSIEMVDYSEEDLKKQMEDFWQFRTQKEKEGAEWAKLIYGSGIDTEHNDINIDVDESLDIDSYPELKEKLSTIKYRIKQVSSMQIRED